MSVPELDIPAPKMKEGFVNILNSILNDQTQPMECEQTPLLSRAKSQQSTKKLLARHIKRRSEVLEKRHRAQVAHKKPNILDTPRERRLQHFATKGVVQLFNAVTREQRNMQKKNENRKNRGEEIQSYQILR